MINFILRLEFRNIIWSKIIRKLSRIFKIYFVKTEYKFLPKNNHPLFYIEDIFTKQFLNYQNKRQLFNKDVYHHLKKNFKQNNEIRFLDYGGENIDLYLFLQDKFPKIFITVVNQPILNVHLKRFLKKHKIKNIKVISNKLRFKNLRFDYINFGSSLQYIKDYESLLKTVLNKNIKFCNIAATSFFYEKSKLKAFIVKQVNLLPAVMYCYFFNYYNIIEFFKNYNYQISKKKNNSFKKINFRNFNTEVKHLDILFRKIK